MPVWLRRRPQGIAYTSQEAPLAPPSALPCRPYPSLHPSRPMRLAPSHAAPCPPAPSAPNHPPAPIRHHPPRPIIRYTRPQPDTIRPPLALPALALPALFSAPDCPARPESGSRNPPVDESGPESGSKHPSGRFDKSITYARWLLERNMPTYSPTV